MTDALTGLRNRRYLFEEVLQNSDLAISTRDLSSEEIDNPPNLIFVMIDLDNFKPINDTRGHLAGDRVLLQVRDVLQSTCRASDIIIRWGGDEFLVIGQKSTYSDASMLAERLRSEIAKTVFSVGHGEVARMTCSIGFACYPFIQDAPDLLNWEQIQGAADAAMYQAKEERNAWLGIRGKSWHRSSESLYRALQSNLDTLVDDGSVIVEKSLSISQTKTA